MRVSKPMDTDNDKRRQELFGNPSKGVIKYKCTQCGNGIENQTEARYKVCGNYCNKCGRHYREGSMSSLERIRTKKRIEVIDKIYPQLVNQLDLPGLTDDTVELIRSKLLANFEEKKALIELLCK